MSWSTFDLSTIEWMMKSPDNQFDMPRHDIDWNSLEYRSIKYQDGKWIYFQRPVATGVTFYQYQVYFADKDLRKVIAHTNPIHYSDTDGYDTIDSRYDDCGYAMWQNLGEPEKRTDGSEYKKWDDDCTCNCN